MHGRDGMDDAPGDDGEAFCDDGEGQERMTASTAVASLPRKEGEGEEGGDDEEEERAGDTFGGVDEEGKESSLGCCRGSSTQFAKRLP